MYYKDLLNYETVRDWFADINVGEDSKRNNLQGLKKYVEFTGMNPDELIEEAEEEEESISKYKNRKIKKYITRFRNHLEGKDELGEIDYSLKVYSPNTVRLSLHAVYSFYNSHEVTTKPIKGDSKALTLTENNKRIEDKGLILKVFRKCSPKQKAIILAIVSSGLASIDIRNLTLQQYIDGYNPKTEICTLHLRRHKTEVDFVTFFNKEATRAINDYLDIRRESKDPTQIIDADNSGYLFIVDKLDGASFAYLDPEYDAKHTECINLLRNKKEIPKHLQPYLVSREAHRQYSKGGFCKLFRDISERNGIATEGSHNVFRPHNIRKFFRQTLENKNVNGNLIKMWMGHELGAVDDAYSSYSPMQLETYMSVMHLLYIEKQMDVSSSEEYIELENKAKQLEIEAENNKVERYEYQQMQTKIAAMEQLMHLRKERDLHQMEGGQTLSEEEIFEEHERILSLTKKPKLKLKMHEKADPSITDDVDWDSYKESQR